METLETDGLFWLTNKPENKIAGRLTFSPIDGAELKLIGSLYEVNAIDNSQISSLRICGMTEDAIVTLDGCLRTKKTVKFPGIAVERYHVPIVLLGAYFDEGEELEFNSVYLKLHHLDYWVAKNATFVEHVSHQDGGESGKITIIHRPPGKTVVSIDIGELILSFPYTLNEKLFSETSILQSCTLGIRFTSPCALKEAIEVCNALKNLVTIGADAPAFFREITLTHSDICRKLPSGKVVNEPVRLCGQFIGGDVQRQARTIIPQNMLFTFEDIGGLDGVSKWLTIARKYRIVIDSLLSHSYSPWTYVDTQFFNSITAAEALIRIRLSKQIFNFDAELKRLAGEAGATFVQLVGNVNEWTNEVIRTRINNVVHRGLHETERPRLSLLADSLYFVVVLCLLRECGVREETLSNLQGHRRFSWLAERIQRIV